MNHDIRSAEVGDEVGARHVGCCPVGLRVVGVLKPAGETEHRIDGRLVAQRIQHARPDVAGHEGDVLGHEPIGVVEEVGSEVEQTAPGDRVVVPFNISCGNCWMCERQLYSQCETT